MQNNISEEIKEFESALEWRFNIVDIAIVIITIIGILVAIYIGTHTFDNRAANEASLNELKQIRELLERCCSNNNILIDHLNLLHT